MPHPRLLSSRGPSIAPERRGFRHEPPERMISQALTMQAPACAKDLRVTDDRLRDRFGVLFRQTYPELCNFVAQFVRSRAMAEELVQDLFLRLWEKRASWEAELPSRSYLYRAARNRAFDHLRHERIVEQTVALSAGDLAPADPLSGDDPDHDDLKAALQRAIERLPERTRQVFTLSRGHGLTYAQIADTLDISVKTVEGQMARAFRNLREELRRYL